MALQTVVIWNGYSNISPGLIKGQKYEIEYEIKAGKVLVTYWDGMTPHQLTYDNVASFAAQWKQPKKPRS